MLILDWEHQNGVERFQAHHHALGNNKPPGMLINGKGRFKSFVGANESELYTPVETFTVQEVSQNTIDRFMRNSRIVRSLLTQKIAHYYG